MSRKHVSKFKIFTSKSSSTCLQHQIPFFPKYTTQFAGRECLRVTWFESKFSQSKYRFGSDVSASNACTLIAILTATKCHYNSIILEGPDKPINTKLIYALAYGMLKGNSIHKNLRHRDVLLNINLTVPEAIKYAGYRVGRMRELKSELHSHPLAVSLPKNLGRIWDEWHDHCKQLQKQSDLYVVLICDSRSVLFILQTESRTVTLVDSHRHTIEKGAIVATVNIEQLNVLCCWFSDLLYRCYDSTPQLYELAILHFKGFKGP